MLLLEMLSLGVLFLLCINLLFQHHISKLEKKWGETLRNYDKARAAFEKLSINKYRSAILEAGLIKDRRDCGDFIDNDVYLTTKSSSTGDKENTSCH